MRDTAHVPPERAAGRTRILRKTELRPFEAAFLIGKGSTLFKKGIQPLPGLQVGWGLAGHSPLASVSPSVKPGSGPTPGAAFQLPLSGPVRKGSCLGLQDSRMVNIWLYCVLFFPPAPLGD